ncbi:MAG: hypothetical protein ACJ72P_04620 [Nocardioides sp.]
MIDPAHADRRHPEAAVHRGDFTSTRTAGDNGYTQMLQLMETMAAAQPGYLGIESVKDGLAGITVSYCYGRG